MILFQYGKFGFIGSGSMAQALIKALVDGGYTNIIASRKDAAKVDELRETFGIETTIDNVSVVKYADVIVLCVKPQALGEVLQETVAYGTQEKLWISIAAGIPLASLEMYLGKGTHIVRTMPNLGSFVGFGCTAYTINASCTAYDAAIVEYLFSRGGKTFDVAESCMDAVTFVACKIGLLSKELEQDSTTLERASLDVGKQKILFIQALRTIAAYLEQGKSFDDIYRKVASRGGATEAAHAKALELGHYGNLGKIAEAALQRCKRLAQE